jgi:hypothetical protein
LVRKNSKNIQQDFVLKKNSKNRFPTLLTGNLTVEEKGFFFFVSESIFPSRGLLQGLGMGESNADLFDPRMIMGSDLSTGGLACRSGSGSDSDFAFAFNDSNFSDRVLRIEIIPDLDLAETKSDGEGGTCIAVWARNRKRRRDEIKKDTGKRVCECVCVCELIVECNWFLFGSNSEEKFWPFRFRFESLMKL